MSNILDKLLLRQAIQDKRNSIPLKTRQGFSRKIADTFINTGEYAQCRNMLIFYPFRSEIDTTYIINRALKDGKNIILPKVKNLNLNLYCIKTIEKHLQAGYMGIMEPVESLCAIAGIEDIDLAVIPGVCFDKNMNRIGYGGGFFDRLIPKFKPGVKKIALCFDLQVLDEIPAEYHDEKMDKIITEKNTYSKKTAILIAAYNEEKYIKDVIKDCSKTGLDIIVVDDGSSDKTADIIKSLQTSSRKEETVIYLIQHFKNRGKGEAHKTGFDFALKNNYFGLITLDADGQHGVNEVFNFIKKVNEENPDIIVGSRFKDTRGMPFIRLLTNVLTSWLISLLASKKIDDVQSGFRYIGNRVLKNIRLETGNFDTETEILLKASWMHYKIINIPISTIYHKEFRSHINPVRDSIKFIRMMFKSIAWKVRFRRLYTTP